MRVIAGEKRHLLLKTIDGLDVRPTTDKIKETLFNMLHFELPGKVFVDMFAGSGAIGIEALSRGARKCYFVDNNYKAIKCIDENLHHTSLVDRAEIIRFDAITSVDYIANKEEHIDFLFMDPPYKDKLYIEVLNRVSQYDIYDNTKIIIEMDIDDDVNTITDIGYEILKNKEYKTNKHIFVRKKI